jgi:hypothetical protein
MTLNGKATKVSMKSRLHTERDGIAISRMTYRARVKHLHELAQAQRKGINAQWLS